MKTNIKDLPDEKLIELCAEAQGWYIDTDEITGFDFYVDDGYPVIQVNNYNPLAYNQAGKAQAMELVMENWCLFVSYMVKHHGYTWMYVFNSEDLSRYTVLAVVASKYGDTIEYDRGEV